MKRRREQPAMPHRSGDGGGYVFYRKVWLGDGGEAAKGGGVMAALPEKARLRILRFLPIKSAIRMRSISSEWRELWEDVSVILKLDSPDSMRRSIQQLEQRGRRGRRRLLLFSVTVDYCTISTQEFNPFLEYAAACSAEAIHIENKKSRKLSFPLQQTSRRLVRLSLIGVKVAKPRGNPTGVVFQLEEIHIFSAELQDHVLRFVVGACPLLRVLDLRSCSIISHIDVAEQAGAHLMSLAVADCPEATVLRAGKLLGLRSFRYHGGFLSSFSLPANDSLTDLCIMFSIWGRTPLPSNNSFSNLPDLSNLAVLTICSTSLRAMSLTATRNAIKRNLRSLRELQLIMFQMEPINLGDIYAFLNNCHCPQLEMFFVQLPIQGCESLQNTVKGEPQEGFEKLAVVKTTNFKYDPIEIKLLQFLFNKANFLQRLILVCPQPVPEERRLQLQPPANVQLTVCADDSTLKSFHSDILPKKTK